MEIEIVVNEDTEKKPKVWLGIRDQKSLNTIAPDFQVL